MSDFLLTLSERRVARHQELACQAAPGGIHNEEAALAFLNLAGFCLLSYIPEVELPSLNRMALLSPGAAAPQAGAVEDGSSEGLPGEDEGRISGPDVWSWKDSLPAARLVYYGAIFHPVAGWGARPGFVALPVLAPLYSLAPILQFGGDRALLGRYLHVSREALAVAEALEHTGALSTGALRKTTGLDGKANAGKFSRALAEAQAHFLVTKVGVTSITRANYGYVWNTFERVFPEAARLAEQITEDEAAEAILRQYLRAAVAAPASRIAQVLVLDPRALAHAVARLTAAGALKTVTAGEEVYLAEVD